MSRIDDLIADLCPHGVEFHSIKDLFTMRNGYTPSTSDKTLWEGGTIPWFRMEDIRENGRLLSDSIQHVAESAVKGGRLFPPNSLIVATSATIGEHALISVPHLSNQRFTSLAIRAEWASRIDMKFVYHYGFTLGEWCRGNTTMSSFAAVDMAGFRRYRIPVPPLEIQREIVRVLDTFAEPEAELAARRKQYEHYRDSLLAFDAPEVPWMTLGDIGLIFGGLTGKSKADFSDGKNR